MLNPISRSCLNLILVMLTALLFIPSLSNGAFAQDRPSAGAGAGADRTFPADRAGAPADRFGGAASRPRVLSRTAIDRDDSRFGSASSRSNNDARFGAGDNSAPSTRSKKSTAKGYTLRGLRENQASCERKFPFADRFKGKKQMVDSRCANGRRRGDK